MTAVATISVEQHVEEILATVRPLPSYPHTLLDAQGLPLALDARAGGEVLLAAGTLLGPRQIGLLAASGVQRVEVRPRPRVVVLAAGAGSVDAASHLLTAAARAAGAVAFRVRSTSEEPQAFLEVLDDQLVRADLVIVIGDVVRGALASEPRVRFRDVALEPGRVQGLGTVGSEATPLVALAIDPVAAYVGFELFVAPALRTLVGRMPATRPLYGARLAVDLPASDDARRYVPAAFVTDAQGARVSPVASAEPELVGGLARANALVVVEPGSGALAAGTQVPVVLLDREY